MLDEIIKQLLDNLVNILVITILGYGTVAINKGKGYLKSKMTDKQYQLMMQVSNDVYRYVEREYGEKLKATGEAKLKIASDIFDKKMEQLKLPYSAEDFKIQVEKIIQQDKEWDL